MAKPSVPYLPDIRGVPPNIIRELEKLRDGMEHFRSRIDGVERNIKPFPSMRAIRDSLQVSGEAPLNATGLLGVGWPSATASTTAGSGSIITHTMTLIVANTAIGIPPDPIGTYHHYLIKQDKVGGHTVTWDAAFDFQGAAEQPRSDSNGVSSFLFYKETATVLRSVIVHRL